MATIFVDNKPCEAKEGDNLLHTCLSLGFDIPYFCWHPALHSVGACRQCAVMLFRDENDSRGRIVMSCMTPVMDGMRISIEHSEAKKFRASIIEWLMTNHPHDCPVCDEGGECHLQDMTVMTGHVYRRFNYPKRTYRNQYLGPLISHEMNRCIQCYRCVRFYRDYAGGRDFNVFGFRNHVYFGRFEEGILESVFSGNLVEVCPTGVFTDKTLKSHYTRKWDLQTAPSVCVHCSLGCNTIPGERYGTLRRIRNRYNSEVNGYFLCDRGRYGYGFVNDRRRIRQPMRREGKGGSLEPVSREAMLESLSSILSSCSGVIGIGSPRVSLEANFALRTLVGPERFYSGLSEPDQGMLSLIIDILKESSCRTPSLKEVASADAVFVVGEDVANTAPMMALALMQSIRQEPKETATRLRIPLWEDRGVREACQQRKGPLFIASSHGTWLDARARACFRGAPDDLARLAFSVARAIDPEAPVPAGLTGEMTLLSREIADALRHSKKTLIISGMSSGKRAVIQGAVNMALALSKAGRDCILSLIPHECNSIGLGLMGGKGLEGAFEVMEKGEADTVIILENDLFRRADRVRVDRLLKACRHVIVIDQYFNEVSERAEFVLPAAAYAESNGTLVNNEGRGQRFFQVFEPDGAIKASWRWLQDLGTVSGCQVVKSWVTFDDIVSDMARSLPVFAPLLNTAPHADFRISGQKISRQSLRYSGRTAMYAHLSVHEPMSPDDPDSALSFSMEGYGGQPPSPLIPRFWAPGWNSVQSVNKFQSEVGGTLRNENPGMRLIEPGSPGKRSYFSEIPDPFEPRENEFLCQPLFHVFGSDELSILASVVKELAPEPYISLHPDDATILGIDSGEEAELLLRDTGCLLRVKLDSSMARGVAGLPAGLPELKVRLPQWGRIRRPGG